MPQQSIRTTTIIITVAIRRRIGQQVICSDRHPVNDPPTISSVANQSRTRTPDRRHSILPSRRGDPRGQLDVSGRHPISLVPDANIVFGGSGFGIARSPLCGDQSVRTTTITITVADPGGASAAGRLF